MKVLKNENINWKKARICSEHWSAGKRESLEDIPDIICTRRYLEKMKKSKFAKSKAKRLTAAKRAVGNEKQRPNKKRRILQYRQSNDDSKDDKPESVEISKLREELKRKNDEIEKLQAQVDKLLEEQKLQEKNFDALTSGMKRGQFLYSNLKEQSNKFLI